jgi:hypothetical protein
MQNYRFTGPPKPGEVKPVDPVLATLGEMQSVLWTIMQRAKFDEDYGTALAAAGQTVANAQLMEAITERRQAQQAALAAQAAQAAAIRAAAPEAASPIFLVALKDNTIAAARSYWVDGSMLNYISMQGVHVTVRLDLVDRAFSRELNRQRNVDFRLPE